jgi:signal transduction histidine kinase
MNPYATQKKIGLVVSIAALFIGLFNFLSKIFTLHGRIVDTLLGPYVWPLLLIGLIVFLVSRIDNRYFRYAQALLFFFLSGPTLMSGSSSTFFGFWFMISGAVLLYKYAFFKRFLALKASILVAWTLFWGGFFVIQTNIGSYFSALTVLIFLLASLAILYFAFEEQIRELLKSNSKKDSELEKQKAFIDQLEPLSVLGERVSHIAHSFKNNLTQLSAAVYYLEEGKNPQRAADRIRSFAVSMSDRIDNVLMVAHAGTKLEPEIIDFGRLLDGVKLLYLEEKLFLQNASYKLDAEKEVFVRAVRWDILLLLENLLKNAIEAIIEKGIYGLIEIKLEKGSLRIANNGGAMPQCSGCAGPSGGSCLDCQKIGRPGSTTKKKGSGTGMSQVIGAVRAQGWDMRIENSNDTVAFIISFPVERPPKEESPGTDRGAAASVRPAS